MSPEYRQLIDLLLEARALIERPGNDFAWSSWKDSNQAICEIDGLIRWIERGLLPQKVSITFLFAPTGPVQEVSISSGWGQEFIELADRLDAAVERAYSTSVFGQLKEYVVKFPGRRQKTDE